MPIVGSDFFQSFTPQNRGFSTQFIPFQQSVSLAGSEWARSVESVLTFTQSDYYLESLSHIMSLVDSAVGVRDINESVADTILLSDSVTVAGGRVESPPSTTYQSAIFDSTAQVGMVLYVPSSGHVDLARANSTATSWAVGLVSRAASSGNIGEYQTGGEITLSDWTSIIGSTNLSPGAYYYLSATTAGLLTTNAPSSPGQQVVAVARALTTETINIEIAQAIEL